MGEGKERHVKISIDSIHLGRRGVKKLQRTGDDKTGAAAVVDAAPADNANYSVIEWERFTDAGGFRVKAHLLLENLILELLQMLSESHLLLKL